MRLRLKLRLTVSTALAALVMEERMDEVAAAAADGPEK
jgi:hypothetical protein